MRALFAGLLVLTTCTAYAAGYDCRRKDLSTVEKTICEDFRLSSADDQLSELFKELLRICSGEERSILRAQQGKWLQEVRGRCEGFECLEQAYRARHDDLDTLYQNRWDRISPEVLSELSRLSNFSEPELRQLLGDCATNQRAINICAFRVSVETDLEMKRTFEHTMSSLPESCRSALESRQAAWKASTEGKCNVQGGSISGMVNSRCRMAATERRIAALGKITTCAAVR